MANATVLTDIEARMKLHWPKAQFGFVYTSNGNSLVINEPTWISANQQFCKVSRTIATFDDPNVPYLLIDQIHIDPVYRRAGMGYLFLKLWLTSARADGITRARCVPSTSQGRGLATKAGFRPHDPKNLNGNWVLELD
jgi:hypothetical protein